MHGTEQPSAWVQRWAHLIRPQGRVLDVACGAGRHMRWLASQGYQLTGVDRNPEALALAAPVGQTVLADIENGPWPFAGQAFDALVVTHYLWRPLFPAMVACLAEGGVLIYETFSEGNASVGKPSRPEFLLETGELLRATQGLRTVAFEEGFEAQPERFIQRIVAVREPAALEPVRWPLSST